MQGSIRGFVLALLIALPALSPPAPAAGGGSDDGPPSRPGEPVAFAYDATFGEIAWGRSRDDGVVVGYEVRRDGTLLGVLDALSYVDRALEPGRTHRYAIVAVDSAGQRSAAARVSLVAPDAPPLMPSGLRVALYSRTAAELFWDRRDVFGERYEIRRDGTPVAVTDGTSHFDDTLSDARPYLFEVIALNRQDRRSAPARTFVDTSARDGGPRPAAPDGLRAEVYSTNAAELFWTRPATTGLRYEVRRDGSLVATTAGVSHFDDTLEGGRRYRYDVVAIDRLGRRSASSSVALATPDPFAPADDEPFRRPDPDGTTTIARLGYPAARDLADAYVTGDYLAIYLDIDDALGEFLDTVRPDAGEAPIPCPGGGSLLGTLGDARFGTDRLVLDGCVVAERALSGTLVRETAVTPFMVGERREMRLAFFDVVVEAGSEGTLTLDGTVHRRLGRALNPDCPGNSLGESIGIELQIERARLVRDGRATVIGGALYEASEESRFVVADAEPGGDPCVVRRTLSFGGTVTVVTSDFGVAATSIGKGGEIVREPAGGGEARAGLNVAFGDGSRLELTLVSDTDPEVQVDIRSGEAAVSFADAYRFDAL